MALQVIFTSHLHLYKSFFTRVIYWLYPFTLSLYSWKDSFVFCYYKYSYNIMIIITSIRTIMISILLVISRISKEWGSQDAGMFSEGISRSHGQGFNLLSRYRLINHIQTTSFELPFSFYSKCNLFLSERNILEFTNVRLL